MPRAKNTTEGHYRALLEQQKKSGLSLAAFSRRHGVHPGNLSRWKIEIRKREAVRQHNATPDNATPLFLPVQLKEPSPALKPEPGFPFEIGLGEGLRVRVAAGFEAADLSRLLAALISEELDYRPASYFMRKHIRPNYACKKCQEAPIIQDLPPRPMEKGRPGPGLLAQIITSKYCDHRVPRRHAQLHKRRSCLAA